MPRTTFLLLIALSALGVRLGAVAATRGLQAPPSPRHGADGIEFDALGLRLAERGEYALPGSGPTSFRSPGLPFLLAGIDAGLGHSYPAAYVAFSLLGAASCLLTYALVRELVDEPTARVAASLCVVYVPHIYFATRFDSENLFVPALAAAALLVIRSFRAGDLRSIAAGGALLGFASLVRPFAILIAPAWVAVVLLDRARRPWRRVLAAMLLASSFAAVITPWTVRNYAAHGKLVLIATNGGSTFYGSNNDLVSADLPRLGTWVATNHLPGRDRIESTSDEVSHDKLEWALGWDWVRDHPRRLPRLLMAKFVRLWLPDIDSRNRSYILAQFATYTPFLALIAAGWVKASRRTDYDSPPWLVLRVTLLATVITALVFWGSPRFRDANTPALMVYAAVGLRSILVRLKLASFQPIKE